MRKNIFFNESFICSSSLPEFDVSSCLTLKPAMCTAIMGRPPNIVISCHHFPFFSTVKKQFKFDDYTLCYYTM